MDFTRSYLAQLVADQIEESSTLEYKSAASLGRTDDKKRDITKDVSALANAAGGILIYGIKEYGDRERRHLPEGFDPVNQSEYSKEWLDQIISLIRPRIEHLRIVPIHVGPENSDYCYVIEIPQGTTAHQSLDYRYYRRRNFESTPMEDYEIRDVMNRRKHPILTAAVKVVSNTHSDDSWIAIRVENTSKVMARYFSVVVHMPVQLSSGVLIHPKDSNLEKKDGLSLWLFTVSNVGGSPLFPGSMMILRHEFELVHSIEPDPTPGIPDIRLTLYADNMEKILLTKTLAVAEREWT